MHSVVLSNYCLAIFSPTLPLWCLSIPSPLSVCRPIICNFIYQNSQTKIITNNIQPAQKSLLIIWIQKHFNHRYSTIGSAEECLLFEVFATDCIFFFPNALHMWVNIVGLVFHPAPAAHPGESNCWTLKSTVIQKPKLIENSGNVHERTLWNALSHTQFSD